MEHREACASYGGFIVNWIHGNDNKKRFKSLVINDGVISIFFLFYELKIIGLKFMKEMNKEKDKINIILKNMFKIGQYLI